MLNCPNIGVDEWNTTLTRGSSLQYRVLGLTTKESKELSFEMRQEIVSVRVKYYLT